MIKQAAAALLSLTLVVSMAACTSGTGTPTGGDSTPAGDSSSANPATEPVSGDRVKISYWHIIPIGDEGYESLDAMITNFNTIQDKYEIEHTGYPFFDFFAKMTTSFSGGVAPDVFMYTLDNVVTRAETETTMNLSPFIERDSFDVNNFFEKERIFGQYNGDYYALPFSSTGRMLYYNLDMFEAAGMTEADVPKTWDELKTVAKKMDLVEEGLIKQLGFNPLDTQTTSGHSNFYEYLWQSGYDFFDENENLTLNTPENRAILDWMQDFNAELTPLQIRSFFEMGKAMGGQESFSTGTLGMMIGTDQLYRSLQYKEVPFKYGVAQTPLPEGGTPVNWSSCWSLEAFNSGDEQRMEGAWEFIKYMLSKDAQLEHYNSQGWLPGSVEALETLRGDDAILNTIIDQLAFATEKRFVSYAPNWHQNWGQEFVEMVIDGTSSEEVLADAEQYFNDQKANYEATK